MQLSGAPTAYAQWESEARTLAVATTGEAAAALACRFPLDRARDPVPTVTSSMRNELGVATLDAAFPQARGWMIASWLVAHAQQFRLTTVSFHGQQWQAKTGRWQPAPQSDSRVRFEQQVVA